MATEDSGKHLGTGAEADRPLPAADPTTGSKAADSAPTSATGNNGDASAKGGDRPAFPFLCWGPEDAATTTTTKPTAGSDGSPPDGPRGLGDLDFTKGDFTEAERTIDGGWLRRALAAKDGQVSAPVVIRHAIIVNAGPLDLRHLTFKCTFAVTETVFKCEVNFSFCNFERGVDLTGSVFGERADFRAARAGGDFRMPLAQFGAHARFDDLYVGQILDAEGCAFGAASFDRADVQKSARFCCALQEAGDPVRARFGGEATFFDACFRGPVYFNGARFHARVYFDRAHFESCTFFSCDALSTVTDSSQPRHEPHRLLKIKVEGERRDYFTTRFDDTASFINARIEGSASFSGAWFGLPDARASGGKAITADFRRVYIGGTAVFDPFEETKGGKRVFEPVHFFCKADFWNAVVKGPARFEAAFFGGEANFEHVQIGSRAYFGALCQNGTPVPTIFRRGVTFLDADVRGTVSFEGAQFCGNATFERLTTGGSLFFRAFDYAAAGGGGGKKKLIVPVRFERGARFLTCRTRSNVEFDSAQFVAAPPPKAGAARGSVADGAGAGGGGEGEEEETPERDEVNFARMEVGGNLYFRPWSAHDKVVCFAKKANFTGAHVRGRAEFSGTRFEAEADFTGMRVSGNTYFDREFHRDDGKASANGGGGEKSRAGGDGAGGPEDGTRGKEKAAAKSDRVIPPVRFDGLANFNGATFLNQVDFEGAEFRGKADFTGVSSSGEVSFKAAKFAGEAVFREARFTSLRFDPDGPQKTGWSKKLLGRLVPAPGWGKRLLGRLLPSRGAGGAANGEGGHGPQEGERAKGEEAKKDVEAKKGEEAKSDAPARQFGGRVDLSGCVYDRIEVELDSLLEGFRPPAARAEGEPPARAEDSYRYDRQPYTQMIRALRAVGDDRDAESVYVEQRFREMWATLRRMKIHLRSFLFWRALQDLTNLALDAFLGLSSKYGVQPERLFFFSLIVIGLGAWVFSFQGAVQERNPDFISYKAAEAARAGDSATTRPAPPPAAIIQTAQDGTPWKVEVAKPSEQRVTLASWSDAAKLSFSQFLPVIDIPSGSKWKPSQSGHFWIIAPDFIHVSYDLYGSIHRVLGAILVPLLLAAVAASLYRRFQSEM